MYKILNNKVLLFIAAILLLANIFLIVFVAGKRNNVKGEVRSERGRSPIGSFLEKELQFTPKQMAEYDKLRQDHRKKIKAVAENLQRAKVQFYGNLRADHVEDSVMKSGSSRIAELQQQLDLIAFQNFRELRALCNEDQRRKYDELIPGIIEKMWFPSRKGSNHSKESNHPVKR